MKRPKKCWWDFNGDGRFPTERIKGFMKRHLRKWYLKEETKFAFKSFDIYKKNGDDE
jgi:hypothetical protein